MNNLDMLELIGNVSDDYIKEAQNHRRQQKAAAPKRRSPWKIALIAAAMALLLMGCAYAVLKLQDKKVAEYTYTKSRDVYGNLMEPTEVPQDVIYPYASAESPLLLAAKEWHDYRYSPDMPEDWDMERDESLPENYYLIYRCYTREMADKLDEIAEKYGLELLKEDLLAQAYQKDILHKALGIQSVIRANAKAEIREHYGDCYPNGTFSSSVFFTLKGEDEWELESFADFYFAADGYFYPYYTSVSPETSQEWNYKTADGTTVLMVMEENGTGTVFADGQGGVIMIHLDPGHLSPSPYPRDENDLPTREDLEHMADLFDYKVKPHGFDPIEVQRELDQREAEVQQRMMEESAKLLAFPECADYGEYLNTLNFVENQEYALYDMNEDGVMDLFLQNSGMATALTIRDGKVEQIFQRIGETLTPCEDGCFAILDGHYDIPGEESYYRLEGNELEFVEGFMFRDGIWRHGQADVDHGYSYPISEEDAQAIRDKYKPLDVDMRSCADFPVNGTTLGRMIAAEPKPADAELRRLYAAYVRDGSDPFLNGASYYALRDITGDGEKDLLLSEDGETIKAMASHYRGRVIRRLDMTYRLRAENVLETTSVGLLSGGSEVTRHTLTQFRNNKAVDLGSFHYVRDTDSWINPREETIPASYYQNLADKYPIVNIDFKPLEELTGN